MTLSLRVVLVAAAFLTFTFIVRKIRKSQIQTMDAFFWLIFSLSFLFLALFPEMASILSSLLGFQAASNFIFVYVIGVLVVRDFSMTVKYAQLRDRVNALNQELALEEFNRRTNKQEL